MVQLSCEKTLLNIFVFGFFGCRREADAEVAEQLSKLSVRVRSISKSSLMQRSNFLLHRRSDMDPRRC